MTCPQSRTTVSNAIYPTAEDMGDWTPWLFLRLCGPSLLISAQELWVTACLKLDSASALCPTMLTNVSQANAGSWVPL